MNIGRSLRISLAKHGKRMSWVAEQLSVSHSQVSRLSRSKSANGETIAKLSALFGMKASEFIAIGEDYDPHLEYELRKQELIRSNPSMPLAEYEREIRKIADELGI